MKCKFLKKPLLSPFTKQKIRIFLAKDLRQYKIEYFNTINYMLGKNWPIVNKIINNENLYLIKIFRIIIQIIILYYSVFIFIY